MSLPVEGFDGPVGVVNLARPSRHRTFGDAEMIAIARLLYPVGVAVERVHRVMLGDRALRHLRRLPAGGIHPLLNEGVTDARNFEFGYASVPCMHEGGDLCVRVPHPNGGQTLIAMDSSGSGVGAAVVTAFAHGMLVATAGPERSAVALVARLNAGLCGRIAAGRHLAVWVGQLSGSGQLSYCNAGLAPPLWVPSDDNPPRPLGAGGPVAGAIQQPNYHEETLQLLPGDLVVGASNGVLYARDSADQSFGMERLTELVTEMRREPLDRLTRAVCEAARNFGGRPAPVDDLAVFAVRYSPGD
jgi:sigma-B regulation protein RsbU (phosphoserine phosphatase)